VEITFKLLYEETNNDIKLNNQLEENMTAVCKQTRMGWGKIKDHISKFKIHTEAENYVHEGMCCMFSH